MTDSTATAKQAIHAVPIPSGGPKIKPTAKPHTTQRRHYLLALSFVAIVILPALIVAWYLFARAADQFASTTAFVVRSEEISSPIDVLGGLANVSGTSSADTDILYEFIQSQEIVEIIDEKLNLRQIYQGVSTDRIFSFDPDGTIEDLVIYWNRMVRAEYDPGKGLIKVRVLAFSPDDAQKISRQILEESSLIVNELSATARADATRYAKAELDQAVERLKQAREAITTYRSRTQIADPVADIATQMGLLETLKTQLAEAFVEFDMLERTATPNDPRVSRITTRIEVIENRIKSEREKFSAGGKTADDQDYSTILAEFERLSVDLQFTQENYTAALAAYYAARSEAQRQSRYLAAYMKPTLAQRSEYPNRPALIAIVAAFAFLGWAVLALVYYSIRDRR
jgi:capsular polysaccharide transport system permease protein